MYFPVVVVYDSTITRNKRVTRENLSRLSCSARNSLDFGLDFLSLRDVDGARGFTTPGFIIFRGGMQTYILLSLYARAQLVVLALARHVMQQRAKL